MISLYTGTVGSGKSYHALALGLNWIKRKHVIANFPIYPPKVRHFKKANKFVERKKNMYKRWIFREEITVQYLMEQSIKNGWFGKESQCLVIIDEAGIIFNSRDWLIDRENRLNWIKFLSQSRKFGYDFVFVAQQDRMIDRQIRGLVEYEVKHRKLNNSRLFSFLSIFKLTSFMYIYKWYGTKLRANLKLAIYKPYVAKRYDTMRVFNMDELIKNIEKLYEGSVIPASVASQISLLKSELLQRKKEKEKARG